MFEFHFINLDNIFHITLRVGISKNQTLGSKLLNCRCAEPVPDHCLLFMATDDCTVNKSLWRI